MRYTAKIVTTHTFTTDRAMSADEINDLKADFEGDPTNENCVENNFDGESEVVKSSTVATIDRIT